MHEPYNFPSLKDPEARKTSWQARPGIEKTLQAFIFVLDPDQDSWEKISMLYGPMDSVVYASNPSRAPA